MNNYGVNFYVNGAIETLSPYESSVFYKKVKISHGVTKLFPSGDNSTPLVFIRAVNYTGKSINGLCDIHAIDNYWCIDLKAPLDMLYEIFIFVRSSYHLSVFPKKWGVRIYKDGVITHASSQKPLRIMSGNNFRDAPINTGVPCAALVSTIGVVGLSNDHGGQTVRVTACGIGNTVVWNAAVVSGQMSTTNISDQYFYIDIREYN